MRAIQKTVVIVSAISMATAVASCGSADSGKQSGEGGLKGEISFQTWNLKNSQYTSYFNKLIDAYEKNHPGASIKWIDQPADNYEQKLSADAAANSLPDIIDAKSRHLYALAKAGALMNLSKEYPKASTDYYANAWKAVTIKGNGVDEGAYGFPWYVNDGPTYYNTNLMRKCGLDPGKLPVTWDDYFEQANAMVASGCGAYMSTMTGGAVDDYASAGIPIMDQNHAKYIFNTPKAVQHLQRFVDLYKKKGIPPEALSAQWSQQSEFFQKGYIVAMSGSAYSAADFKQNSPDLYRNLTVGKKISDEGKSASVDYEMLAVNAQTKNKALALDFAHYVTNAKNQLAFAKKSNTFPSSKGGLEDPYYTSIETSDVQGQALQVALNAVKNGYACRPAEFSDSNGKAYLQQQVALALQGKQSAQQALDKSVKFANEKLK